MTRQSKIFKSSVAIIALSLASLFTYQQFGPSALFKGETTSIERWCGEQIKSIANDLLGPTLVFDDFDYTFPATITLTEVRLKSGAVVILQAASLQLILRDIPARGKPLVIDTINLTRPIVRLAVSDDGTLAGFGDFIKPNAGHLYNNGGSTRPSDILAIRKISIQGGAFHWTAANGVAMELDELEFDLDNQPESDPGWYGLRIGLTRAPVLDINVAGRFQLNDWILELDELDLDISLDEKTRKHLPPGLQSLIAANQLKGQLAIHGMLNAPFKEINATTFDLKTNITDAFFAKTRVQIPLKRLEAEFLLADQRIQANNIEADIFGGSLEAYGSIDLGEAMLSQINLNAKNLRLERALKETAEYESHLAGAIDLKASASATLQAFPSDLNGSGQMTLAHGHLWDAPIFQGLMNKALHTDTGEDTGSTDFTLHPNHVAFTNTRLVGKTDAAHGEGELFFDNRINLRFNVGPIERFQETVGPIGQVLQLFTDRIVTYQVTGSWSKPTFKALPLGLGIKSSHTQPPLQQPEN